MCRHLLLLLSLVLSFVSVGAQTQTVTLSGQLRSGTEPVAGAVLALLQPSDSSLLTYTISDSEGRYRLQLETSLPALVLRVRSLGFKRRLLHLKAQSQTLDLNLEHEERLLREVIVKAQKLWAQRDTLNYLVSAYTLQQDRTIGDVLQRLPGITIEDNKVIKYQGLPINLRLKDRAKGIWSKALRLGAGGYTPGPLWDASLQAMHFGKKRQHLLRYSSDNLGQEFDDAVAHYGGFTSGDVRLLGLVVHGRPPVGNGLFGYRHRANLSTLTRLTDSASLSYNLHYRHQLSHGSSFAKTTYLLPEGAQLQLTEDISDRTRSHAAEFQLN